MQTVSSWRKSFFIFENNKIKITSFINHWSALLSHHFFSPQLRVPWDFLLINVNLRLFLLFAFWRVYFNMHICSSIDWWIRKILQLGRALASNGADLGSIPSIQYSSLIPALNIMGCGSKLKQTKEVVASESLHSHFNGWILTIPSKESYFTKLPCHGQNQIIATHQENKPHFVFMFIFTYSFA